MRPRARTYSHLASARRIPSEYEITSTGLHWYVTRGYATDVPVAPWRAAHQVGSPLQATWSRFADPRQTTYFRYVELQRASEVHVDRLLHASATGAPAAPTDDAKARFERVYVPMRHAWHGLQMVAAYVGHLAPEGRITIAAAFEAADHVRRVQRVSERVAHLWPGEGPAVVARARTAWETAAAWQPLRRVVERLLVTWDWGEALVALHVVLGPALDRLLLVDGARTARAGGDPLWAEVLAAFEEDGRWHRAWSSALLDGATAERPENREVIDGWVERWRGPVDAAVAALAPWLEVAG